MVKLAIVGSRNYGDEKYPQIRKEVGLLKRKYEITEIITGGARGIDTLAARYAREENIPLTIIRPDWKKYGRSAGILRNKEIVNACDILLAVWNGASPGTEDTIQKISCAGKPFVVI